MPNFKGENMTLESCAPLDSVFRTSITNNLQAMIRKQTHRRRSARPPELVRKGMRKKMSQALIQPPVVKCIQKCITLCLKKKTNNKCKKALDTNIKIKKQF